MREFSEDEKDILTIGILRSELCERLEEVRGLYDARGFGQSEDWLSRLYEAKRRLNAAMRLADQLKYSADKFHERQRKGVK